ncbi:gamma-glutamyl-gamma-aminobutyrate hydrolase family protein [Nakamurella sp. PAMC28650]|uniref:gamma-glutamyl-gamma-aminobutyrate hydrolase family protein n=1 Tax=Nakamurella sp. PAMC28650 TaxID=2762325 RepID=UPI00164E178D|nr:gamma-glutamyl-gamma-aminobutyrate hydrolase family protein [Nakamurella sp. PAMC28650]QNK81249.1 gamma-glutamyl-gamma-aminobutyrate hydrolase family protein [Nakamurella sp. PAMC28650]
MTNPVIGISTYREPASWGQWDAVPAVLLPARYVDAVRAGGGTPVLLPPLGPADDAARVLSRLDALVIAGGADVNPSRYGEHPDEHTSGWRDDRDVSEYALLDAADDLGLPVLGICRGMQVMASRAGGRLHQHVPDLVGDDRHSPGPGVYGPVAVTTIAGSRLAQILGPGLSVPCHHHQSVAQAPGFTFSAFADDGVPEAMEAAGERFVLAVQWHPETATDMRLFTALAQAAG